MRALISVSEKRGLDRLASGLAGLGWELVASGGTAAYLAELGVEVIRVEKLTEAPELLGGRVKTLHPRVHAGILARRDRADDVAALDELDIAPFDLVCVNLYPFERAPQVELIDVGGPALLRAGAKNHEHVVVLSRPEQYERVLAQLRAGDVDAATRRALAAEAFALTAAYDAAIAAWLGGDDAFPDALVLPLRKERDLAYGENPHQRAAYYAGARSPRHLLTGVDQLHGRPLSYNNLNDLAGALALLADLDAGACVIVKHANPCGAAIAPTVEEAYERALACDPLSAYGGVVAVGGPIGAALAERLAGQFVEVLWAPGVEPEALELLRRRPSPRLLAGDAPPVDRLAVRSVPGGALVQERDRVREGRDAMRVVCGAVSDAAWDDLLFAWRVCAHVSSNAIVVAKDGATLGIGAGQQSRVDAVGLALEKARAHGHDPRGAVLASDAFFPFADGAQLALDAGVSAIVQPGGSKRDDEVIEAVRAAEAAMVFTGRRHFRH